MTPKISQHIFDKCLKLWRAAEASLHGIAIGSDNRTSLRQYLYNTRQISGGFEDLKVSPIKDKENELWITRVKDE